MNRLIAHLKSLFTPTRPLPAGIHHFQSPQDSVRLHLRLQKDGTGILIVNAATILHLNQTAAEYAFHLIKGTAPAQAAEAIAGRYRVGVEQARSDFQDFCDRVLTLAKTVDVDPVLNLGFDRVSPNSSVLTAPLRLDCALTYLLPEGTNPALSPTKRVSRELTTHEWTMIMDAAWARGVPHIVFTGGEPTLREDLPDLVAHAERNGQVCGLLTDGHRLEDREYLETLLKTGLDHLMFVLPLAGEPNWQALQNTLVADIFLAVHLTVTPENLNDVPGLMEKLFQAGVEAMSLSISKTSLQNDLARLHHMAGEMGLRVVFDLPVPYSEANPVALETAEDSINQGAGRSWLYIEPDGDVLPAQGLSDKVLGNILTDPWEKIYPVEA